MDCAKEIIRAGPGCLRRVGPGVGRLAVVLAPLAIPMVLAACAGGERPAWEQVAVGKKPAVLAPAPPRPTTVAAASPTAGSLPSHSPGDRDRKAWKAEPLPPLGSNAKSTAAASAPAAGRPIGAAPPAASGAAAAGIVTASAAAGSNGTTTTAAAQPPAAELTYAGTETLVARHEDTLLDIATQHNLGFIELATANPGVDPWLPGAGTKIVLPKLHLLPDAAPRGIVLNISEQRLYYYDGGKLVRSFPIGIGRDGHATPLGSTKVVRKQANPTWYPTPSARADDPTLPAAFPPGPDNPLGTRAMYLGWTSYLIHGTNKEYGIGRRASRGCIRTYNADAEWLFARVAVGTPVTAVDQPIKLGFLGDDLYLEAAPSIRQVQQWEEKGRFDAETPADLRTWISTRAGAAAERVDWQVVDRAVAERRGIPVRITRPAVTAVAAAEEESFDLVKWLRKRLAVGQP